MDKNTEELVNLIRFLKATLEVCQSRCPAPVEYALNEIERVMSKCNTST